MLVPPWRGWPMGPGGHGGSGANMYSTISSLGLLSEFSWTRWKWEKMGIMSFFFEIWFFVSLVDDVLWCPLDKGAMCEAQNHGTSWYVRSIYHYQDAICRLGTLNLLGIQPSGVCLLSGGPGWTWLIPFSWTASIRSWRVLRNSGGLSSLDAGFD